MTLSNMVEWRIGNAEYNPKDRLEVAELEFLSKLMVV